MKAILIVLLLLLAACQQAVPVEEDLITGDAHLDSIEQTRQFLKENPIKQVHLSTKDIGGFNGRYPVVLITDTITNELLEFIRSEGIDEIVFLSNESWDFAVELRRRSGVSVYVRR